MDGNLVVAKVHQGNRVSKCQADKQLFSRLVTTNTPYYWLKVGVQCKTNLNCSQNQEKGEVLLASQPNDWSVAQ